ncbi:MAG: hypothetical protein HRT47_03995 [Candidatus Caenarcaniphilales bacterium]|nr:hypothetical protein [Candidatus Caenarcaniphilales bacterium]
MKKLRRKFPANFSDLLFIWFIAWCVSDMGHIISDVYVWKEKLLPDLLGIIIVSLKFVIGVGLILLRISYNHRSNG